MSYAAGSSDGYSVGQSTTEWEDALVKHKIIERREKPPTQDEVDTKVMWEANEQDQYANKSLEELRELEDDLEEDHLEELRRKRLAELRQKATGDKFGRIKQISKPEYQSEVTEASKKVTVLCCLFMHGQEESRLLLNALETLAARFKDYKFVKIVGQECIENYPDNFCPTLLIYLDENPVGHIKGLAAFGGKAAVSADVVEWELADIGIWKTTIEQNPRQFKMNKIGRGGKPVATSTSGGGNRFADDDDDSDLDLD